METELNRLVKMNIFVVEHFSFAIYATLIIDV